MDGTTTNYTYTYDPMGRLLTASRDGSIVEQYQYSSNGTRTYEENTLRGITGWNLVYSEEDHLLTAGSTSYQYNTDGFLTSKTQGGNSTSYQYSSRGELLSVSLPDGRAIEYLHDPLARRIGKKVNGNITEKYLWQGRTRLLAVYDGNDNLLMRFNYADGRMPVSMVKDGSTYYLMYDQVGSLKAVTDSSGNVVKNIDYDSFGNIITDTNSSFTIPFGFAGGLYDQDTGLVRFGYRDYFPEVGRWTAKDPILFRGGDTDLFAYLINDPINYFDKYGLDSTSWRGDGRSIWDGPKNGNWGGKNWSGGWNPSLHGGQNGPLLPTDSGDICYMNHDNCYTRAGDCGKAERSCDLELVNCLNKLPSNSKEWPSPPKLGTEGDSETFRDWATNHFTNKWVE
ncbi:MAG: hypothetical protein A2Y79_07825 [Deltaproteobacteria bacterium RBG_13_43_22]|nr:MAG: hypothetical protein A2Y79_07825 [Deltaproteobacteria bacterium RBG_13_43_22]